MGDFSVENKSPFYTHTNNSSSSNIYPQTTNVTSNVSSVGFNTLKKTITNSSSGSSVSTATIKTNPLTRLFTRNRSSSNIFQAPGQSGSKENLQNNSDDDSGATTGLDLKKHTSNTSKFRLNSKNRLFSNKNTPKKPDLTISTNGHHGLKVSKKILSSNSVGENVTNTGRKNSVSSPVSTLHNLFHRSQSNSQLSNEGLGANHSIDYNTKQKINNNPSRTTFSLSSNNSNSFVSDVDFAMIYKFTDPNYPVDETEGSNDHSLLDIHKKMLMPTDQYLQNRVHKNQHQEMGLGILGDDNYDDYLNQTDFDNKGSKFLDQLFELTKPLFLPSKQKVLGNGSKHPYLGFTIEDLAVIIKDNYTKDSGSSIGVTRTPNETISQIANSQKSSKSKLKPNKFGRANSITSAHLNMDQPSEKVDEYMIHEISLDLFTYFVRCMTLLKRDSCADNKNSSKSSSNVSKGKNENDVILMSSWENISSIWEYFNFKIRYTILGVFQPLQNSFRQASLQDLTNNGMQVSADIDIENSLLSAFREVIINPFLLKRRKVYEDSLDGDGKLSSSPNREINSSQAIVQEESLLRANPNTLHNLVDCFGVISCITHSQTGNIDSEQHIKNQLFNQVFDWLTKLI